MICGKKVERIRSLLLQNMSNMMSRNEGVWLSNGWGKVFLWIFLPCFYIVISIVYFFASCIDK